jgi:erythromycin esterase
MPFPHARRHLRPAVLIALAICTGLPLVAPPVQAAPRRSGVVRALAKNAHPLRSTAPGGDLRDLRPLGRMVKGAKVVGLGEATHNSHEFFTLKHRVFRYLVEEKGFTTFALEVGWGSGLRINDYVLHGRGDIRRIMRQEFRDEYVLWNSQEYLDLFRWMREHNRRHRDKVQFMGDDVVYPHDLLFEKVTGYVRRHRPGLLPRFAALYDGLRPGRNVGAWRKAYLRRPRQERRRLTRQAIRARTLLRGIGPGSDREAFDRAMQHARVIVQVAGLNAFNPGDAAQLPRALRYRDRSMAENTAWWHEHTGHKILLSAHNGHIGYESGAPRIYPKPQGAFLRDRLGARYVNVGLTFYRGSFNAHDTRDPRQPLRTFTVGPPPSDHSEHVLDKVRLRDYLLDLRTVPEPARAWLGRERPIRSIGAAYPAPDDRVALRRAYDILIHLHRVHAARNFTLRTAGTSRKTGPTTHRHSAAVRHPNPSRRATGRTSGAPRLIVQASLGGRCQSPAYAGGAVYSQRVR